jgi:hypothetical protein
MHSETTFVSPRNFCELIKSLIFQTTKSNRHKIGAEPEYFSGYTEGLRAMGLVAGVRFPAGANDLALRHRIGSGAHPASYTMDTGGFFPEGKTAEA